MLHITHTTTYRYSGPVAFGRHRLVLRPREGHDLRVESHALTISPEHDIAWSRDVFGNSVALVDFYAQADTLSITSDVQLLRHPPLPRHPDATPWPVPYPVIYDPLESAVAAVYRATSYPDDTPAVLDFLKRRQFLAPTPSDASAEHLIDRLNSTLNDLITYNRRPEKGTQSPATTLSRNAGSCRDIATLMMECCRALGIAARFASGYLDCAASTAGIASTHAWLEAYLPPHGWIAFDPTLGERCSHKHIPTGLSNHPRGVMPISGTFTSTPTARFLSLDVAVRFRSERSPADCPP